MTIIDDELGTDAALPGRIPIPLDDLPIFPWRPLAASGTYTIRRLPIFNPQLPIRDRLPGVEGGAAGEPPIAFSPIVLREELRLDVDRSFPQMTASGATVSLLSTQKSWIASLSKTGPWRYEGAIWHTDGYGSKGFAYDHVEITVTPSYVGINGSAVVTFSGAGGRVLTRTYPFESASFHPVQFEFDSTSDSEPITQIGTHDHPNRPSGLANETLSIETVFRRAGFDVTTTAPGSVPVSGAGVEQHVERRRDARRDAGLLVAFRGCSAVGAVDVLGPSARSGPQSRRHHVRRHRAQPPAGNGDLHRLVHPRCAGGRPRAGCVGPPDALLDGSARDGARLQPRALVAEGPGNTVDPADEPARGAFVHELPVLRVGRTSGLLRRLRQPVLGRGAAVHAARAVAVRADGQRRLVRRPRRRAGLRRAAARRIPTAGAREP